MNHIDLHSHILPAVDDGARDVETSLELIRRSASQGVQTLAATPHFYAFKHSLDSFLDRRAAAAETLREAMTQAAQAAAPQATANTTAQAAAPQPSPRGISVPGYPRILLGSEVSYFPGMAKADLLDVLTYEGTRTLLLELPFDRWDGSEVETVEYLIRKRGFTVVLAHLERFMTRQNKRYIRSLMELPLYVQINAEAFADKRSAKQMTRLFTEGKAHLLGSDCHSLHRRPPNLEIAYRALEANAGSGLPEKIDALGRELLGI